MSDPITLNIPTDIAVNILSQEAASGISWGVALAIIVIVAAIVVWWQN